MAYKLIIEKASKPSDYYYLLDKGFFIEVEGKLEKISIDKNYPFLFDPQTPGAVYLEEIEDKDVPIIDKD